jgi:queuine tRNA-ribosyltransferase
MPDPITFTIESTSGAARTGRVETPHGGFDTPAFMPVGTRASVKGVFPHHVRSTGAEILLNNTYHLMLRPGSELIRDMGGVHRFMNWDGPILTDSGGYQAYSMADINAIDEDGVSFKSIIDGSKIRLTPEIAIRVQNELGPDIMMAFDDCPPSVDPDAGPTNQVRIKQAALRDAMKKAGYDHDARLSIANERTVRWLERCKAAHARPEEQALFGIIQGGADLNRRDWCIERICNIDLPGYAIGGVAVGETTEDIARIVRHTAPKMPAHKPRYLMGVGYEHDITSAVLSGVDMFDCVLPTRNGRNAHAFTNDPDTDGQLRLKNARHARDERPLESGCDCPACDPAAHGWATCDARPFSRGYIRHLFISGEMLGPILVTLHNLRYFQRLMQDLRDAINADSWGGFQAKRPRLAPLVQSHLESSGEST